MHISTIITGSIPRVDWDTQTAKDKLFMLGELARAEWVRLAQTRLKSTAAEYIAGIQPVEAKGMTVFIHLVGGLPNDLENGKPPFDMKPGLLNGPRAKRTKKGTKYNIVPFRHGTPGTTARNVGAPMPMTGLSAKGKAISAVYVAAKALTPSLPTGTGKTAWGGSTGDFGGLGMRTQLPVKGGRPGAYTWKSSPYEGIYKIQQFYKSVAQNQYVSFRMVSENSDPSAWWHPGFAPRRFAQEVGQFVDKQAAMVF